MAPGRGSIVRVGVLVVRLCADELMRARTIRCVVVLVVVDARDGVLRTFAFRFGFVSLGLWVGGRRLGSLMQNARYRGAVVVVGVSWHRARNRLDTLARSTLRAACFCGVAGSKANWCVVRACVRPSVSKQPTRCIVREVLGPDDQQQAASGQ